MTDKTVKQPPIDDGQVRVINELRQCLNLTSEQATDAEILALTKGSLMRSSVATKIAMQDFNRAVRPILEQHVARINKARAMAHSVPKQIKKLFSRII